MKSFFAFKRKRDVHFSVAVKVGFSAVLFGIGQLHLALRPTLEAGSTGSATGTRVFHFRNQCGQRPEGFVMKARGAGVSDATNQLIKESPRCVCSTHRHERFEDADAEEKTTIMERCRHCRFLPSSLSFQFSSLGFLVSMSRNLKSKIRDRITEN